jgi:hypothetical protein
MPRGKQRTTGQAELPKPIDIGRLLADHPQLSPPLIDGLLRRGETGNIIADPKRGKSWLAYGLGISICVGIDWLDTFPCYRGKVLLIDNELHSSTLAHRIPAVADAMAIRPDEYVENFDVRSLRGRLVNLYGIVSALESIKPGTYDLVILDAFYRALPPQTSENDNAAMAMLVNEIDKAAGWLGCAWVNIHHASKGNQATKSITDVGAGAGAQSRAADCHLIPREQKEPGCIVLESVVRSFKPVGPMTLRWNFPFWTRADGLDPAAVKGRGSRADDRKQEALRDDCYKMIEELRSKLGRATKSTFQGAAGESGVRSRGQARREHDSTRQSRECRTPTARGRTDR